MTKPVECPDCGRPNTVNPKACRNHKDPLLTETITCYQMFCWYCGAWWLPDRLPVLQRHGLNCRYCKQLNEYEWSDKEYAFWCKKYGKEV